MRLRAVTIVVALIVMTVGAVASKEERVQEGRDEAGPVKHHSLYVIFYRPGPAWKDGEPMSRQGLRPHGMYLKRLLEEGKLMAAGPLPEMNGGLVLTRVDSRDQAMAIVESDPAVKTGVFVAEVRSWVIRFTDGAVSPER